MEQTLLTTLELEAKHLELRIQQFASNQYIADMYRKMLDKVTSEIENIKGAN